MKRLYKSAESVVMAADYGVALDGKPIRTPGKRDLVVPNEMLAAAIAAEWNAQSEEVHPASMPMMRLATTTLDNVSPYRQAIVDQTAKYAGTDLICYRAARPPTLSTRQQAVWQPLIDWAVLRFDAPLKVIIGVIPQSQSPATLRAFAAAVAERDDFTLTALRAATTASGSLVIGLALLEGHIDAEQAFAASQLDESFQIEAWGEDAEQAERRRGLAADIEAAARFAWLLRCDAC